MPASFSNVHKGFVRIPVGFVKIEGVLTVFAVKGDQSTIIDTRAVSPLPVGCSIIEHVGNENAPQIWRIFHESIVLLVQVALPPFGVPVAHVVGTVQRIFLVVDAGSGTITQPGVEVAPIALQLFQPDRYVRGQTLFPTQNVIPCDQLRDEVHLSVLVACADSHSGWIFAAGLCIQLADERGRVVTPHVLIVEKSPHGD